MRMSRTRTERPSSQAGPPERGRRWMPCCRLALSLLASQGLCGNEREREMERECKRMLCFVLANLINGPWLTGCPCFESI